MPTPDSPATEHVQYGCGLCAPATWTNFDVSPTLRARRIPFIGRLAGSFGPAWPPNVRYGDIVRGLPVPAESCAGVYCSHVLEHLAYDDVAKALKNTLTYLRPGGRFRFVLPDLEQLARVYVASGEADAAHRFMEAGLLGQRTRRRGAAAFLRDWIGNSRHLWMWDFKAMAKQLADAGFFDIRRATMGDSADGRFRDVEDAERWRDCLGMECRRPDGG
jgi:SAM-dependent methyltransferase